MFSADCVSYEIRLHVEGYLWAIGNGGSCPIAFSGYWLLKGRKDNKNRKDFVKEACKFADIYEADVYLNKDEAAFYGFDYMSGIADCYFKTKCDPYYDKSTGNRSANYYNKDWLTMKLVPKA